jgi:rare lipoprotein A
MRLGKTTIPTARFGLNLASLLLLSCSASSQARSADSAELPPYPGAAAASPAEPGNGLSRSASARAPQLATLYSGRPALETFRGEASYYSERLVGRPTASGEVYDPKAFTAAHRTLPFDTVLRVVRVDDGRAVYVRVNDRGPFGRRKRVVDLSFAAAEELEMLRAGVIAVRAEVVAYPDAAQASKP